MNVSASWSAVADVWEALFPLRQARIDMCASLVPSGGTLLDAGCGTGSLVRALLPLGIDASGFDLDTGFVDQAKKALGTESDRLVQGDLTEIGNIFPGVGFDAIVCLGQTFPHLLTDSDVGAFLGGVAARLKPDGRLLLQVVSDSDDQSDRTLPVIEADGLSLRRRRILTGPDRAVLKLVATGPTGCSSWEVVHRRWTPEALTAEASRFGLTPTAVWSDESKRAWTGSESGWIVVLAKS